MKHGGTEATEKTQRLTTKGTKGHKVRVDSKIAMIPKIAEIETQKAPLMNADQKKIWINLLCVPSWPLWLSQR